MSLVGQKPKDARKRIPLAQCEKVKFGRIILSLLFFDLFYKWKHCLFGGEIGLILEKLQRILKIMPVEIVFPGCLLL